MTVQQLKYILKVAEVGSITEAAKLLFISQPSLSNSIKETEKEAGITIFLRSRTGITLTKDGAEFLGYARQVIQQMELLEDRYVTNLPGKVTFGVSSQHYTFTENAFVELVKRFGQERYAFYYNETGTHQILDDVKNRVCDLGIHNLEHADAAYEWLFQKEPVFHMMKFEMSPKGPKMIPVVGELSEEQKKLSAELKAEFPAYVNSLGLKDDNGIELTLEENGEGTFKDYVMSFVSASAKKEKETHVPA